MNGTFEEYAYHQRGGASLINHKRKNPNSFEIIQIVSGEGSAFIQDRTYPLSSGMLLFIDAASLHCITPADVSCYCRNKLIVAKEYLQDIFRAMQTGDMLEEFFQPYAGTCFYLSENHARQVDGLFRSMETEFREQTPHRNLQVLSSLLGIFTICAEASRQVAPREDDKLAGVMQYLRSHYPEPLTVETIAAETHMSKFYLCHLFRKQTGLTLMQYLYEQRLAAARQQLQFSTDSISTIAQNCGFGSSSHFCTLFRRREGMSPREYRAITRK